MHKALPIVVTALVLAVLAAPARECWPGEPDSSPAAAEEADEGAAEAPSGQEVVSKVSEKVSEFSRRTEKWFDQLAHYELVGWIASALLFLLTATLLLFGWALLRTFFVPVSGAVGSAAGALLTLGLVAVVAPEAREEVKLVALVVGVLAGGLILVFSAMKMRPFACMFIVLSPFLIISTALFPLGRTGAALAILAVLIGVALGCMSMHHMRPMAILSTSLLGAVCLTAFCGALTRLWGLAFLQKGWVFLMQNPLILLVGLVLVALGGANFQWSAGPGELPAEVSGRPWSRRS